MMNLKNKYVKKDVFINVLKIAFIAGLQISNASAQTLEAPKILEISETPQISQTPQILLTNQSTNQNLNLPLNIEKTTTSLENPAALETPQNLATPAISAAPLIFTIPLLDHPQTSNIDPIQNQNQNQIKNTENIKNIKNLDESINAINAINAIKETNSNIETATTKKTSINEPNSLNPLNPLKIISNNTKKLFQTGLVSWYGPGFHGKQTASGKTFDMFGMSAAHRYLPLGTKIKVLNPANQKSIVLEVNDRGPYAGARVLDVSFAAAKYLDMLKKGVANLEIYLLTPLKSKIKLPNSLLNSEQNSSQENK